MSDALSKWARQHALPAGPRHLGRQGVIAIRARIGYHVAWACLCAQLGSRVRFEQRGDMDMATITDVARRAKVTRATVSNVITQRVSVSPATRARALLQAIEELGYRPNLVARGLAQGKTSTLALVIPTISNPFFAEVVEEVERVADQHDYQLLLA